MVQHDTDQLTFDEIIILSISLISKIQLANQNRVKNYNITPFPNNIYVSPSIATTIPSQHQITTIYTFFVQFYPDQNDSITLSTTNKKPKKPLTVEQKKYRFENNLYLDCGKPGHKIFAYKFFRFTQRINFIIETFVSPTPAQFTIDIPPTTNQGKTCDGLNPYGGWSGESAWLRPAG